MVRVHGVADACVSEFWPVNYYVLLITWIKIMEWGQFYLILTRWIAKLLLQSTYCTYLSLVFHYVNMEGTFSCSCVDCWHEDGHEPLGKIGCASLPFCVCSFNWSTSEVKWSQATSWAWYGFDDGVGMCSYDVTHLVINERHILVAMDYCTK